MGRGLVSQKRGGRVEQTVIAVTGGSGDSDFRVEEGRYKSESGLGKPRGWTPRRVIWGRTKPRMTVEIEVSPKTIKVELGKITDVTTTRSHNQVKV